MPLTIHFETLGCRLNQDESEGAAHAFEQYGFNPHMEGVTAKTPVDRQTILCIINTCTVTSKAEQKARRLIRLMLEKYPCAPVVVTGCYAQLDAAIISAIAPERIVVLSGTKKYNLALIAQNMAEGILPYNNELESFVAALKQSVTNESNEKESAFKLYTPVFAKHSRASLKVQDGCNCSCSFCRIHLARGKSTSLSPQEVLHRVREIEERGINELVFTGVNLSQYSALDQTGKKYDFADLLSLVLENTSRIAFRISSYYPQSINDKLCSVIAHPRIQPFFHLSIQSGSDRILKLMNRPHSVEHVRKSIELLRSVKDRPFISCDIIAGFPGETEEDFAETQKLCKGADFAWIHAFPYSPRPGTTAEKMRGQVPERIKDERVRWLTDFAINGKISYVNSWIGQSLDAIVENSRSQRIAAVPQNLIHAVSSNMLHIECRPQGLLPQPGSLVKIKVTGAAETSIRSGGDIDCTGLLV